MSKNAKEKREILTVTARLEVGYLSESDRSHLLGLIEEAFVVSISGWSADGPYHVKSVGKVTVSPQLAADAKPETIVRRVREYLAVRDRLHAVALERFGERWQEELHRSLLDERAALDRLRTAVEARPRKRAQSRQNEPGSTNKTPTNATH